MTYNVKDNYTQGSTKLLPAVEDLFLLQIHTLFNILSVNKCDMN